MKTLLRQLRDPRFKGQKGMRQQAADEIERLRNEVGDLEALIAAYRKWARACPILENKR